MEFAECHDNRLWCYDCEYRYCSLEEMKYTKLKRRASEHISEGLFWIDIDFERDDEVSLRAFERFKKWMRSMGYKVGEPSYKTWIEYREDASNEPVIDCGYHTGTAYFHKIKKG